MRVVSSNISEVDYNRKTRELKVIFNKRPMWEYTYYKVPPRIWVELVRCDSKGRYFKDIIKPRFEYSRIVIRNNNRRK